MDISFFKRQELSYREIARKTGSDPRTVKKYCQNPDLINKPRKSAPRASKVDPYRDQIAKYLNEDVEYRASTIFDRLCRQGFTGGYEIVKRAVRPIRQQKQGPYGRFETEPGAQAQVDFGEFQVQEPDGTVKKYFLFALILGFSRMLYAELLDRCDMVSFLEAHQRVLRSGSWTFSALGGVPHEILYDRMKNVFLRHFAGKTEFTQSLMDLAVHYGFTPRVAPAPTCPYWTYAPWVKGKIERPMDFIRESFWRGYSFTDLATANRDLDLWLAEKAKRVHGTTHERVLRSGSWIDERFERERQYLSPLPPRPCDVSQRLYRDVRKDCTIAVLGNRYVVEHTLVGCKVVVRVRVGDKQVRVFDDDRLVVTYEIPDGKGHLVQYPKFYEALKADRKLQERKFSQRSNGGKFRTPKGRAIKQTISPTKPPHPIDVSAINVSPIDVKVDIGIEVESRSLADYAALGGSVRTYGEVRCA